MAALSRGCKPGIELLAIVFVFLALSYFHIWKKVTFQALEILLSFETLIGP